MKLTLSNFNLILKKIYLHENKPRVAIGVSGGPDSIALTYMLSKYLKQKNGNLIALVVDHQMRKQSAKEAKNTFNYLRKIGVNCKILKIPSNNLVKGKMSDARSFRFKKLFDYCRKNKVFHLFLAHHHDDNIETFLLRKTAGSNLEGLNCINEITINGDVQIIRPFLNFSKNQILKFNHENNLQYINDPTNKNFKYTRSIIRNYLSHNKQVIPDIEKEFKIVKKYYFEYKKMVFNLLNILLLDVKSKSIIIDFLKIQKLNPELQIKIFDLSIKFLKGSNIRTRAKKTENIINFLEKPNSRYFKSYDINFKKNGTFLSLSLN